MKKFSILIAHYNNFEYFKDCYASLLKQTFSDFEVIIVDDCSTDDSYNQIIAYTKTDPRVKVFKNSENKGVGFTKKECILRSTGAVCAFVDPDDALSPNAIETSLSNHTENNVVTYSSFTLCDNNLKPIRSFAHSRAVKNGSKNFFNVFLEANHFFSFKRSAYDQTVGINPKLTSAVDQDLYLKLYDVGNFTFIKEALYLYRLHPNGVSQDATKKNKLTENWHQVILDTLERRKMQKLYGKTVSQIPNLPLFLKTKQNNLVSKILRKFS